MFKGMFEDATNIGSEGETKSRDRLGSTTVDSKLQRFARAMSSAKAETDRRWPLNRERDRQRLRRRSRRCAGRDDNSSLRDCVKRLNSGNRHDTFDHSNEIVRSDMMLVEEGKKIKFVFCYFR